MFLLPLLLACGPLLLACGASGDCDATDLPEGSVQATIDGQAWTGSGAQWSWAGDSAQVSTAESDGWRFTIVAATDTSGTVLNQVLEEGVEISVEMGQGSFLAAYPTGVAGSYAANEAGDGSMVVERLADSLAICFDASGTASDGSGVEIADGRLLAACAADCE